MNTTATLPRPQRAPVVRAARRLPPAGSAWDSLLYLGMVSGAVAWAIQMAGWLDGRLTVLPLTAAGLAAGALLARWRVLPPIVAHWTALVLGGWLVLALVGPAAAPRAAGWEGQVEALALRFYRWADLALRAVPGDDPLLLSAGLAGLTLAVAYAAAWTYGRRGWLWASLLPAGLCLLLVLSATRGPSPLPLAAYLLGAAALLARHHADRRAGGWLAAGIVPPTRFAGRLVGAGVLAAGLAVGASWLLPELARHPDLAALYERVNNPWRSLEQAVNRATASFQPAIGTGTYATFGPGFEMGGVPALSDAPVARVAGEQPRYLTATTYDRYTGRGWQTTTPESFTAGSGALFSSQVQLNAGTRLPVEPAGTALTAVQVEMIQPKGALLLTPGRFVAAPQPVNVRVGWVSYDRTALDLAAVDPADLPGVLRPLAALLREARDVRLSRIAYEGRAVVAVSNDLYPDGRARPRDAATARFVQEATAEMERLGRQRGIVAAGTLAGGRPTTLTLTGYAPRYEDVEGVYAGAALAAGTSYGVLTPVGSPTAETLRAATGQPPAWVRDRYLALPVTVPDRVRTLAAFIARGEATPYDRAKALERALRTLPYDLAVGPPPAGADAVDHFLFESRRGYCEHFAAAMVVMARSLGIPARMVVGYNPGEVVSGGRLVRERNAHAWAEVYLAGHGWVAFEPTPAIAADARGESPAAQPTPPINLGGDQTPLPLPQEQPVGPTDPAMTADGAADDGPTLPGWLGPVGRAVQVALLLGLVLTAVVTGAWWRGVRGLRGAGRWYGRLHWLGRWAGLRPAPAATPLEYAAQIGRAAPTAADPARALADFYVQERYAGRPLSAAQESRARRAWLRARAALVARILRLRR